MELEGNSAPRKGRAEERHGGGGEGGVETKEHIEDVEKEVERR